MEVVTGWRTSSRTSHQGQCVEVGFGAGRVGVRDTKNRPGGHLTVTPERWEDFVLHVKRGDLDLAAVSRG